MKLSACAKLERKPESRVWYRAIQAHFWQTALQTLHTREVASRYNPGRAAVSPYEVLYLAEEHVVALYEVGANVTTTYPHVGAKVFLDEEHSWTILNVQVQLRQVADLTIVSQQELLKTTVQELTGDWQGYRLRTPKDSVSNPTGIAPTQALGQALFALPELEGFRSVSARWPSRMNLVIFPEKLHPGSFVEFADGRGNTHRIESTLKRRRPK